MTDSSALPPQSSPSQPVHETPPKKGSTGKKVLWALLIICLIAGIAYLARPQASTTAAGGKHGPLTGPMPVVAAAATKGDIAITRRGLGTITPLANVTVRTQISGLLMELGFQEGQIVNQGDFLAQIDPRPYQMTLEQAQGTLQRDQALLKEAELNLDRYRTLFKQDSIAKQQVDTQESLVDQYKGDIVTDQGQIDTAKLNLTYCHITAPVTGRVGLRQVDVGNYAQTSDTNGLVTVTQLQPISVLFTVPEDDVPALMKRLNSGAELQATAYDRTQSTKLATGKLVAVDNQIDTTTGTVKIRAQFDNTDNSLYPNQFVNIELLVDTLHDAIILPSAAIQRGQPGTFVYLIKDDNSVTVRKVALGPTQGDNIAITDGIAVGDKVVIDGADKLKEGSKVTLPGEKTDAKPDGTVGDGAKSDTDKSGDDTGSKKTHHHKNSDSQ